MAHLIIGFFTVPLPHNPFHADWKNRTKVDWMYATFGRQEQFDRRYRAGTQTEISGIPETRGKMVAMLVLSTHKCRLFVRKVSDTRTIGAK